MTTSSTALLGKDSPDAGQEERLCLKIPLATNTPMSPSTPGSVAAKDATGSPSPNTSPAATDSIPDPDGSHWHGHLLPTEITKRARPVVLATRPADEVLLTAESAARWLQTQLRAMHKTPVASDWTDSVTSAN